MKKTNTLKLIIALFFALAMTACGGGGGGGGGTSTAGLTVAVTGDGSVSSQPSGINCGTTCNANFATSTVVTLTATPAAGLIFSGWGGACSGATATCSVTMSQARNVTAQFVPSTSESHTLSITVTGGGAVSSDPAGINCGTACSANYAAGTSVTLTATPASGQLFLSWGGACAGTTLTCAVAMTEARSVTATFAPLSGQAGWSDEMVLTAGGGTVRSAIDNDGNAILLFLSRDDQLRERIFTSRYTPAGGWSSPILLESNAVGILEYQLAMDPTSGKAMAVWQQLTTVGAYDIWARPFDPASGWGAATAIDNTAGSAGAPTIGVDAQGNAVAIWPQIAAPLSGEINLYANRYVAGSGWETAQLIETSNRLPQNPALYVAPNGNALAIWNGGNSSADAGIWTNQYTSGSGWGTASGLVVRSVVGADDLSGGRITGDANGNATLVYSQLEIETGQITNTIYAKRYQGGWQSANTPISAPFNNGSNLVHPFIQMNAQGAAIALWADFNETRLTAAIGSASGTWGTPAVITTPDQGDITGLALDIDGQGHAFVAWTRGNSVGYLAQYTGTWGAPTLQDNTPETSHQFPSLAMNERGNAILTWNHSTPAVVSQIVVRHYTSGR